MPSKKSKTTRLKKNQKQEKSEKEKTIEDLGKEILKKYDKAFKELAK